MTKQICLDVKLKRHPLMKVSPYKFCLKRIKILNLHRRLEQDFPYRTTCQNKPNQIKTRKNKDLEDLRWVYNNLLKSKLRKSNHLLEQDSKWANKIL